MKTSVQREKEQKNNNPFKAIISIGDLNGHALIFEQKAYTITSFLKSEKAFTFKGAEYNSEPLEPSKFKVLKKTFTFPKSDMKTISHLIKKSSTVTDTTSLIKEDKSTTVEETNEVVVNNNEETTIQIQKEKFCKEFDQQAILKFIIKDTFGDYNNHVAEHNSLAEKLGKDKRFDEIKEVKLKYTRENYKVKKEELVIELNLINDEIKKLQSELQRYTAERDVVLNNITSYDKEVEEGLNSQIAQLEQSYEILRTNNYLLVSSIEEMKAEINAKEIAETLAKLKELTGVDYVPDTVKETKEKEKEKEVDVYTDENESEYRHLAAHLYRIRLHREKPNKNIFKEIADLSNEVKLSRREFCEKILNMSSSTFYTKFNKIFEEFGLELYRKYKK